MSKFSQAERTQAPFPLKRRLMAPCWYSRLLFSNLLATSIFIETPGNGKGGKPLGPQHLQ